ncbi:MAG: hypothetical protein ACXABK_04365 [Candidatus Heimdallarchaeaceae archaeon]|jgi:hypothetical protein
MKRDLLLIGTISVIVIAFVLSLLNIYVFPNIFFQSDIYRNTTSETQLELLHGVENIGLNSSIFDSLNRTQVRVDYAENNINNITIMIKSVELKRSSAFNGQGIEPRRINFEYNGTIFGVFNESTSYEDWISTKFDNGNIGTYFGFKNASDDFEFYSTFSSLGSSSYSKSMIINNLSEIFNDVNRKPDFVIYQTVYYFESRGLLNEYSTEFQRIVFVDSFGDIKFFLSNEGIWDKPLLF